MASLSGWGTRIPPALWSKKTERDRERDHKLESLKNNKNTSLNIFQETNSEWLRNVTKVIEPVSRIRVWI